MKTKKLLLICPTVHKTGIVRITPFWLPPLGLASVAGLTPENWEIKLIDENVEDINFDENFDLLAIGFMTANSKRAYAISNEFRKRNKTVIMGGPHATVCPDEVSKFADAVVVGDAEVVWQNVLEDFSNKSLKKNYNANLSYLKVFSTPKREIFRQEKYLTINSIQTTRGCPHACSFCSIASRYKRQYAKKTIDCVLNEIDKFPNKKSPIFFVDDNIFVDRNRSKEFLEKLKDKNIKWWSQADINILDDNNLLELAKESGCIKLVVGFESLSHGSIDAINKTQNSMDKYEKIIQTMHNHGILINTSFSFGGESDTDSAFEKTFQFLKDNKVIFATFNILTPLPGTELFLKMKKEDRIIEHDWTYYNMGHPVFTPKNMSSKVLKEGYDWICKEFYSLPQIQNRILTLKNNKDKFDTNLILAWNLGYKKMLDTFGVFM